MITGLLSLIITIVVLGFIGWLLLQIPMPAPYSTVVQGLFVVFLICIVLSFLGVINFPIPHFKF